MAVGIYRYSYAAVTNSLAIVASYILQTTLTPPQFIASSLFAISHVAMSLYSIIYVLNVSHS